MDSTLAMVFLLFFCISGIPVFWIHQYQLNVPSDAQMELYLIIFCLLWFAFTVGNYAEWAVDFDAGTWWWNYWDFTYLSDRFRIALEIDPLRGS